MAKRKKRLEKGISSLQKQIDFHLSKKDKASKEGKLELVNYYGKEIIAKERDWAKKITQLYRKDKKKFRASPQ